MKFGILAGRMAVGTVYTENYTDGVEALLCEGRDSENIAILAGYGVKVP